MRTSMRRCHPRHRRRGAGPPPDLPCAHGFSPSARRTPSAAGRGHRIQSVKVRPSSRGVRLAGFILVCPRDRASSRFDADGLRRCALRLSPDDIEPNQPQLLDEDGILRAVVNPVAGSARRRARRLRRRSLRAMPTGPLRWRPCPTVPLPSCATTRARWSWSSDAFASRTIWYVLTEESFLVSTSQRALASLLGDFRPNAETVAWMVSSGFLGPLNGWDARVRRVPGGTCLRLDRAAWAISATTRRIEYRPVAAPRDEHVARLREAVFTACRDVDLSGTSWVLPLSGGHDSRALLVGLLATGARPTCADLGAVVIAGPGRQRRLRRPAAYDPLRT